MRIAVPTANNELCAHFGHCEVFSFLDVNPENREITGESQVEPPPHEPGLLPRWLSEQGATVIIAGGMGQRAQALFRDAGIGVIVGAPVGEPKELARLWLKGELSSGRNLCDH